MTTTTSTLIDSLDHVASLVIHHHRQVGPADGVSFGHGHRNPYAPSTESGWFAYWMVDGRMLSEPLSECCTTEAA